MTDSSDCLRAFAKETPDSNEDPWELEACSVLLSSSRNSTASSLFPEWPSGPIENSSLESPAEVQDLALSGNLAASMLPPIYVLHHWCQRMLTFHCHIPVRSCLQTEVPLKMMAA